MISCFPHESGPPSDESLFAMLGEAAATWRTVVDLLEIASGAPGTWKSYGTRTGCRLDFRKKAGPLAGIYPQKNGVLFGINLIQKEWAPAFELPLSPATRQVLETSEPLKDGRFLFVPIKDQQSLQDVRALVQLKTGKPSSGSRK